MKIMFQLPLSKYSLPGKVAKSSNQHSKKFWLLKSWSKDAEKYPKVTKKLLKSLSVTFGKIRVLVPNTRKKNIEYLILGNVLK
jgi:hypothetical protein